METPEGTNRSADPWPLMQAPATRFRRTRSILVIADASTCDAADGPFIAPSGMSYDTGARSALAMGLSTNLRLCQASRGPLSTVRPRSRVMGLRPRCWGRAAARGGGQENARRNRRSWAESPRASSNGLKASGQRPLRARTTMAAGGRSLLAAYPRPWNFRARIGGVFHRSSTGPCRAHGNARRNQSVRRSVAADASTRDSVPSYHGPSCHRRCKHLRRR